MVVAVLANATTVNRLAGASGVTVARLLVLRHEPEGIGIYPSLLRVVDPILNVLVLPECTRRHHVFVPTAISGVQMFVIRQAFGQWRVRSCLRNCS